MPNWKKVITSGSDASLNSLDVVNGITGSDITIDDWGSVSASLASIESTSVTNSLYTGNGTLSSNRQVNGGSNFLSFTNLSSFSISNSPISLEGPLYLGANIPTATGSALDNTLYMDDVSGEVKYGPSLNLQKVTDNGATTTNSITASALRLDENGTGVSLTNVGAFKSSSGFLIFSDENLRFSTNGSSNEALSIDTSQHSTFAGNITTNGIITVDNSTDARLILDRNATSNDSEIVFRTNGIENWSIGTGQVGLENDFTLRYNNAENYFRLEASGNLVLSNDIEIGGNAIITGSLTGSDITIDDWGSVSASLTTINSSSEATTLQDIINNGTLAFGLTDLYEAEATGSIILKHTSSRVEAGQIVGSTVASGFAIGSRTTQLDDQPGIANFAALKLVHAGSQSISTHIGIEPINSGSENIRWEQKMYPLDYFHTGSRGVYFEQFSTGSTGGQVIPRNYFEVRDSGQHPLPNYVVPLTASVNLSTPRLNVIQREPDGVTFLPGEIDLNRDVQIHSSRHEINNNQYAEIGYGFDPTNTAGCKMDYVIICCASGSRSSGGVGSAQRVGTILASWDDDSPINATFTETTTLDTSNGVNSTENAIFSLDTTGSVDQVNVRLTNTTGGTIQVIATWTQFTINYTI